MYVSDVALDDFRSYRHALLHFEPGVTVLTGPNGQGKTNLVEAIAFVSTLSSHRVGTDSALVRAPRPGENVPAGAVVRLKVNKEGRERILELEIINGKANRAKINRTKVRPRELSAELKTVVFAPEDLSLVRAEPAVRRRFLDDYLGQSDIRLAQLKTEHEKVLKQRGALLKQLKKSGAGLSATNSSAAAATLQVWNEQLANLAAKLIIARKEFVTQLEPEAALAHEKIAPEGRDLSLRYQAKIDELIPAQTEADHELEGLTARLLQGMAQRAQEEMIRGVNLVGAHRDDLELYLDHLPVKGYASHGETWSVALSLRLGAYGVLGGNSEDAAQRPVLILDDVFAELDEKRRAALAQMILPAQQVLITAAVPQDLPECLNAHQIRVRRDEAAGSLILDATTSEGEAHE
ncbi:DNA replication/repair protein RecF [Boudabousia liubingyangii]|uniref:DNA replication/repair protein RecF n=1 Tax=Boudabousia liubingyangii TaxID=1921764 RepID=UPI00093B36BA|nr:DNA replication/repair protein RecF [Boudabousia liubingyangii]OKL48540.1 DNA replication/repair protein RecF [Boudabousia liubingyangii]